MRPRPTPPKTTANRARKAAVRRSPTASFPHNANAGAQAHRGERKGEEHDTPEPQCRRAQPAPGRQASSSYRRDFHDPARRAGPSSMGVSSRPPHSVQLPS
jgi:hypothetical protein